MTGASVAIILLNWNGWGDTLACIESLLQSTCRDFQIVVCDNDSQDGSWQQMLSWASGTGISHDIRRPGEAADSDTRIVFMQTGSNLGFAGGCNVGLRFALQQPKCKFAWLLNNDTVVEPDALSHQLKCMEEDSSIGLLGSTIAYDQDRGEVQCFGGYGFNFWTARVRPLPFAMGPHQAPSQRTVEPGLKYISGASTFVSRRFVEQVGLLNEQYFLYFEEIDWAVRGKAFRMSYCPQSLIFHKEGRSIGSARSATLRSSKSELWLTRNRILFIRTYYPYRIAICVAWVLMVALLRMCSGRWKHATVLMQGIRAGIEATISPLPELGVALPRTQQTERSLWSSSTRTSAS